jgi:hypothetical protein
MSERPADQGEPPRSDALAGISVSLEGVEDLSVRRSVHVPAAPLQGRNGSPLPPEETVAGISVLLEGAEEQPVRPEGT